jgi:hypothetical protein
MGKVLVDALGRERGFVVNSHFTNALGTSRGGEKNTDARGSGSNQHQVRSQETTLALPNICATPRPILKMSPRSALAGARRGEPTPGRGTIRRDEQIFGANRQVRHVNVCDKEAEDATLGSPRQARRLQTKE